MYIRAVKVVRRVAQPADKDQPNSPEVTMSGLVPRHMRLPPQFATILPGARVLVSEHRDALLTPLATLA